jgi:hypothetical protein
VTTLNADLHCHSVMSDGTLTPEALALHQKAAEEMWSRALKGAAAAKFLRGLIAKYR